MTSFKGVKLKRGGRYVMSSGPIERVYRTRKSLKPGFKPVGLWYSCGPSWLEWIETEMPSWLDRYTAIYEIKVDLRKMVVLRTPLAITGFSAKYGDPKNDFIIDWPRVAKGNGGIEICPYQWSSRLVHTWYYPWDVASGCIWDPEIITSWRQLA